MSNPLIDTPVELQREICSYLDSSSLWKLKYINKEFSKLVQSHKPPRPCKYCGLSGGARTSNESKFCCVSGCMTHEFHPQYASKCSTYCDVYQNKS